VTGVSSAPWPADCDSHSQLGQSTQLTPITRTEGSCQLSAISGFVSIRIRGEKQCRRIAPPRTRSLPACGELTKFFVLPPEAGELRALRGERERRTNTGRDTSTGLSAGACATNRPRRDEASALPTIEAERFSHCPHRSAAAVRATWALAEAVIRVACYFQTGTAIAVHRRTSPGPKLRFPL